MLTFPISQCGSQSSQARARQPSTCDREQKFCRHEKNKLHDAVVCHRLQRAHVSCIIEIWGTRELRLLFCSSLFSRSSRNVSKLSRVSSSSFGGCWLLFTSSQFSFPAAVALDPVWRLKCGSNDSHCTRRLQFNASKVRIAGTRMKIKEKKRVDQHEKEWRSEFECLSSISRRSRRLFSSFDDDFPHNLCTSERRWLGWRWL